MLVLPGQDRLVHQPGHRTPRRAKRHDDKALATLAPAIGQVTFYMPLAVIGKSPAAQ